jgi:hypothetical protein
MVSSLYPRRLWWPGQEWTLIECTPIRVPSCLFVVSIPSFPFAVKRIGPQNLRADHLSPQQLFESRFAVKLTFGRLRLLFAK